MTVGVMISPGLTNPAVTTVLGHPELLMGFFVLAQNCQWANSHHWCDEIWDRAAKPTPKTYLWVSPSLWSNSKQVILQMAMSSQHCCLDLFLFCFLFKMLYECHMLFWAYQYPRLSPSLSLPPFNRQYLSWVVFFHSLLGKWLFEFYSCCYSPCEVSVPERNWLQETVTDIQILYPSNDK